VEQAHRTRRDHQGRPRSADWDRRRPTPCSPRFATSATSTSNTSAIKHVAGRECVRRLVDAPCSECLPGRRGHPRLRLAGRREALRRSLEAPPRDATRSPPSAPGSASTPARTSAAGHRWTTPSPSAASSASWSTRRSPSSCPEVRENEENAKRRKIAIVGAGPAGSVLCLLPGSAGLSSPKSTKRSPARRHARPGHSRLPAAARDRGREVRMVEQLGVDISRTCGWGRDFTLKALRAEGCRGRVPGRGRPARRDPGHPRRGAEGITDALSSCEPYNLRGSVPKSASRSW
jgi:hypothetical protein